ncbi:MAG: hypothetical protein M1817_000504 [Caeruleum heppii]|nr:MAG: hypothetical protein M1817_000504 [Caeruleum heppii]
MAGDLGTSPTILDMKGIDYAKRYYEGPPRPPCATNLPSEDVPHITVIRPIKGLEPNLYECLAATFRQEYPRDRMTIYLCISSRDDPAYDILERLLADFPSYDAKILVEEDDTELDEPRGPRRRLGPNPKIRNMSRAYREAKGDILWVIDCNVWVGKGVGARMVDKLCGLNEQGVQALKYKFVHHLPLVVDVGRELVDVKGQVGRDGQGPGLFQVSSTSTASHNLNLESHRHSSLFASSGGKLEEAFFSSSHAKFYTAINTVLVAPCIVGKSNMYRRSHLNHLTATDPSRRPGIEFFSDNICEDHLIGDLLWKRQIPPERAGEVWGKHALVFGDLAVQPMAGMSVNEFISRRIRWLRVRKFTVTLATLVEPGTESFLCSLYGAYGITTLSWFHHSLGVSPTWTSFVVFWAFSVMLWALSDWTLYQRLQSGSSIEMDENTPAFVRPPASGKRRPIGSWIAAWLGREALALPIWTWAFWGGTRITWRGRSFQVGVDMKVHELRRSQTTATNSPGHAKEL